MPKSDIGSWLNAIHQGDCLDLLARMPGRSVGLIVTSPPYNLGNSTGNGPKPNYDHHDDCMPDADYVAWQRECLKAMMRVLTRDGAIFYNHKHRVQNGRQQSYGDEILDGFPVRQEIIWKRSGGHNHNPGYFLPTYELVYLIVPGGRRAFHLTTESRRHGAVWTIHQDTKNRYPGSFPVELARRCITGTNAKIVLDPFIGSGTTAIAALKEGRQYVGIDISPYACDLARRRIYSVGKPTAQRIVDALILKPGIAQGEIAALADVTVRTVQRFVKGMVAQGLIVETADTEHVQRKRYKLARPNTRSSVIDIQSTNRDGYPDANGEIVISLVANGKNRRHAETESLPDVVGLDRRSNGSGENRRHAETESLPDVVGLDRRSNGSEQNRRHPGSESLPDVVGLDRRSNGSEQNRRHPGSESLPDVVGLDGRSNLVAVHSIGPRNGEVEPRPTESEVCPVHGANGVTATTIREIEAMDRAIGSVTFYCAFAKRCSWRWNSHPEIGEYHPAGVDQPPGVAAEIELRRSVQPTSAVAENSQQDRGGYLESYRRRHGRMPWEDQP